MVLSRGGPKLHNRNKIGIRRSGMGQAMVIVVMMGIMSIHDIHEWKCHNEIYDYALINAPS